jgi:hypothetical protein
MHIRPYANRSTVSARPMQSPSSYVPGFKPIATAIGIVYVLLASSMLARGAEAAMRPFGVPEPVLSSPYYADCFHFMFVHMVVLGITTVMLGRFVTHGPWQRMVARVLCVINVHYAYLDFRTSDSVLGNALYRGAETLGPPVIGVVVALCWAYLGLRSVRAATG